MVCLKKVIFWPKIGDKASDWFVDQWREGVRKVELMARSGLMIVVLSTRGRMWRSISGGVTRVLANSGNFMGRMASCKAGP